MSIKLMSKVWESNTTSGSDRLVLLALADSANDEGYCWPAYDTIAAKANLGRRYVIQIVGRLEEMGLIVKTHRFKEGDFTSNLYRVVVNDSSPGVVNHSSLGSEQGFTRVVNHSSLKPSFNRNLTINDEEEEKPGQPNVYALYESEIGLITPLIADKLQLIEKEYPFDWIQKAFKISSGNNARNINYIETCLKNMRDKGVDWKPGGNGKKATPTEPGLFAALREASNGD